MEAVERDALEEAIALFGDSLATYASVPAAHNLALALEQVGRLADAANVSESLLAMEYGAMSEEARTRLEERLSSWSSRLGRIELATSPRVTWIRLDDSAVRRPPRSGVLHVEPGAHVLRGGGEESAALPTQSFSIAAGAVEHIELHEPLVPPEPAVVAEASIANDPITEISSAPSTPARDRRALRIGLSVGAAVVVAVIVAVVIGVRVRASALEFEY